MSVEKDHYFIRLFAAAWSNIEVFYTVYLYCRLIDERHCFGGLT